MVFRKIFGYIGQKWSCVGSWGKAIRSSLVESRRTVVPLQTYGTRLHSIVGPCPVCHSLRYAIQNADSLFNSNITLLPSLTDDFDAHQTET